MILYRVMNASFCAREGAPGTGHATWVLPTTPLNRRSFRLLEQVAEPPGERKCWAEVSESPSGSVKKAQVLICGSLPQLCQEPDAVASYLAACASPVYK